MKKALLASLTCTIACGTTTAALGQTSQPAGAHDLPGELRLDTSFYHDADDGYAITVWTPTLEGRYRVDQRFALSGGVTMAIAHGGDDDDLDDSGNRTESAFGGIYVVGDYLLREGPLRGSVGLEFGTSLHHYDTPDEDDFADTYVLAVGAASRGAWNVWRFLPNAINAGGRAHLVWSDGRLRAGLEGAAIAFIRRNPRDQDGAELLLQAGVDGAYDAGIFAAGLRFRGFGNVTGGDGDLVQLSLEPYVEADLDQVFFEAALTMNLDDPQGFAFDEDGIWGIRAGAGARF